jgi:hypothetical protein
MEKIETLLKLELNCKFDTPKKLNRSNSIIPDQVIQEIENKEFTFESLELLAKNFPVFKYQTCITIHGNFPEISTTRIGQYKNIHQNKNGSVEVYYSAIDTEKINQVVENIHGMESGFYFRQSSQDRSFEHIEVINRENYKEVFERLKLVAEKLRTANIYGHVHLYKAANMFQQFLVVAVTPLAIPASEVMNFTLLLCDLDIETYRVKKDAYNKEIELQRIERENERAQRDIERQVRQKELNEVMTANYLPQIAHLSECKDISRGVLISITSGIDQDKPFRFIYYRLINGGNFGRVKYQIAYSDTVVTDLTMLQWQDKKQMLLSEINARFKNTRLLSENKNQVKPVKTIPAIDNNGLKVVDYSEKSFAIIGDTKPVKEILKNLGGSFNFRLTCGPGWIFPKSKYAVVSAKFNLKQVA